MIKRLLFLALILLISGCNGAAPTADPNDPILTGVDALPKQLATIYLSPTPEQLELQATQLQSTLQNQLPTATLAPATYTPTLPPHVGVFLGEATFEAGDVLNKKPIGTPSSRGLPGSIQPGIPVSVPTVVVSNPGVNLPPATGITTGNCTIPAAPQFANPAQNALIRGQLGCPVTGEINVTLVIQPFQKGFMIWRDTRQIYALSFAAIQSGAASDTLWISPDSWAEGQPESDGSFVPPAGLLQPVRGFGLVWRTNQQIRDALGWATSGEQPYQGIWQDFERGWMMTSADGRVFALIPGSPTGVHFGLLQ
ncbi:MAG: hypothetical protein KF726_20460 [Anaerolineae bacterium]|nr:hypothetical protein [Anaerolineae bacterium]